MRIIILEEERFNRFETLHITLTQSLVIRLIESKLSGVNTTHRASYSRGTLHQYIKQRDERAVPITLIPSPWVDCVEKKRNMIMTYVYKRGLDAFRPPSPGAPLGALSIGEWALLYLCEILRRTL